MKKSKSCAPPFGVLHDHLAKRLPRGASLAFDVGIGDSTIGALARRGHPVLLVAKEGEPDEEWVENAYFLGVECVISRDADVGNLIEQNGWEKMKWVPQ